MDPVTPKELDELKREWTDQFVRPNPARPELKRFAGRIGKVITVNWNGKALVDFSDGGWYDIPPTAAFLEKVTAEEAKGKYDGTVNSAQVVPPRQS